MKELSRKFPGMWIKDGVEFLDQYDLNAEAYDSGTYFIFLN